MMDTIWIDDSEQLRRFCRDIEAEAIAVDTESDHFHAYRPKVCLIQVATPRQMAFVDPLAIDERGLAPLLERLADDAIEKVIHSARNDLRELDRDYGIDVRGLFDTQVAARFLDYDKNSLSWLLEAVCDVDGGSGFSRFDWTRRPLPDEALRYAEEDVIHLLALRRRFRDELKAVGWDEAFEQQCAHICRITEFEPTSFDEEGWRDVKGASTLDGRGRAALRALYLWRHRLCLRINRAPVTIFPDAALKRLAETRPESVDALEDISRIPRPLVDDYGAAIVDVVDEARGAEIPPASRNDSSPRRRPEPPEQKHRYRRLRHWRNDTSDRLGIPTEFIATNATLRRIVEQRPTNLEELAEFESILDWHCNVFGREILDVAADR